MGAHCGIFDKRPGDEELKLGTALSKKRGDRRSID